VKVGTGRREGERIEITVRPRRPRPRVVASGGGFLADGDTVRVVDAPSPPKPVAAPAPAAGK
jgi:HlyD family secretion protein